MTSFKDKLIDLFNDSVYNFNNKVEYKDPHLNFTKLILEQQNKIRNITNNNNNNFRIINYNNYKKNNNNNNIYEYNFICQQSKKNYNILSRNKSCFNINNKEYPSLFSLDKTKKENAINNINTLMRSFTLNDIHINKYIRFNLNNSLFSIDYNDTEKNKNDMKKKILKMQKFIGLDKEETIRRNINNKPPRNLDYNLCLFNKKEYYSISPNSRLSNNKKKQSNNKHFIIKDWDFKINNKNNIKNILSDNNYLLSKRKSNINNSNIIRKEIKKNINIITIDV